MPSRLPRYARTQAPREPGVLALDSGIQPKLPNRALSIYAHMPSQIHLCKLGNEVA